MKYQTQVLLFVTGISVTAIGHTEPESDLRKNLLDSIDQYETLTNQWSGNTQSRKRLEQLRQQLLTLPEEQISNADPMLTQQSGELKNAVDSLTNSFNDDFTSARTVKSAGFPSPEKFNVAWAEINISPSESAPTGTAETVTKDGKCDSTKPRTARQRYDVLQADIALEAIKDIAEQVCQQDILGENVSLACIVTDIAYLVADGINENVSLCEGLIDAATLSANYSRLEHVHGDLSSVSGNLKQTLNQATTSLTNTLSTNTTSILNSISNNETSILNTIDNSSTNVVQKVNISGNIVANTITNAETSIENTIVNTENNVTNTISTSETKLINDISAAETDLLNQVNTTESNLNTRIINTKANLTALIEKRSDAIDATLGNTASALKTFRDENLRHLIEANLADGGHAIGSFQLSKAHGGYLELVDTIVRETIDNKLASSQSIAQAERDYQNAKTSFDNEQFKESYKSYRLAYKAAIQ
ncbi:MAG: hypothetical protein ACU84J_07940 [Gammaproteobacteria bacterium]